MLNKHLLIGASLALALGSGGALAGVSAGEAAQLKSSLTPLGAEKAGNAAGSIPPGPAASPRRRPATSRASTTRTRSPRTSRCSPSTRPTWSSTGNT